MKGFLIKLKKNETFCRKKTSEVIIESNINKNKIKLVSGKEHWNGINEFIYWQPTVTRGTIEY